MKVSKRQLRRIIKEETARLTENRLVGSIGFGSNAERGRRLAEQPRGSAAEETEAWLDLKLQNPLFDPKYIKDLLFDDFADIEPGNAWVSEESFAKFEKSVLEAIAMLRKDFVGR